MQQGNKPKLRTRLPSLLSPGKNKGGKQWKQAATLNGKPYTIGATPSPRAGSSLGMGMREAEFERMLLGGGAVTKVLTLDGAARAAATTSAQVPPAAAAAAGQPLATPVKDRGIQGPIVANRSSPNVNAVSGAPPTISVAKPDAPPMSPASPAGGTGTAKKSRFRFPVGRENRHMIPSEYDTVDFETRLASYSDDEVNGNGNRGKNAGLGKGARGRDKDDAWVDILVASSAKRMTGQDAELRPRVRSNNNGNGNGSGSGRVLGRTGSGHSDPELASQEVERALAAVQAARQMSPPTDDEADEVGRMRRELAREVEVRELTPEMLNSRVRGRSRSASPQPPPSAVDDEDEDDDDEKFLSPALRELQQKKGRGYFDLHPDRRPALEAQKTQATAGHGYPYSDERNTMYSDGDFEPSTSYNPSLGSAERLPDGDIEVPAFVDSNPSPGFHREFEHAKKDSMVLPALLSAGVGGGGSGPTGRTAQLIEMYREREKQGMVQPPVGVTPVTPTRALPLAPLDTSVGDGSVLPPTAPLMLQPKPSRLPVRSSSLQNDLPTSTTAKKVPSALVPGAGPPSSIPMPTQGFDLDDEDDLDGDGEVDEEQLMRDLNPPRPAPFVAEDLGRVSPMRYVHGAPLHNVLEEGEEEE